MDLLAKIASFASLEPGWNGYDAPPPTAGSIQAASRWVQKLAQSGITPSRVAPSVVGGIGITVRDGCIKTYYEFYNDGQVYAMTTNGNDEPHIRPIDIYGCGERPIATGAS